ncbi:hypothetical protein BN903_119 [Halorubrum sp. AJ67]|nr:hypothetical protein BN903_119 [Halorubrum sp. AJ67]
MIFIEAFRAVFLVLVFAVLVFVDLGGKRLTNTPPSIRADVG